MRVELSVEVSTFYNALKAAADKSHADALRIWYMNKTGISNVLWEYQSSTTSSISVGGLSPVTVLVGSCHENVSVDNYAEYIN